MSTNGAEQVAVLFDWDGVIIDSSRQHEESWERLAHEEKKSTYKAPVKSAPKASAKTTYTAAKPAYPTLKTHTSAYPAMPAYPSKSSYSPSAYLDYFSNYSKPMTKPTKPAAP